MRLVYMAEDIGFAQDAADTLWAVGIPFVRDGEQQDANWLAGPEPNPDEEETRPATFKGVVPEAEILAILEATGRAEDQEPPDPEDDQSFRKGGYPHIGIYVMDDADYGRGSEILLKMGAAPDKPVSGVLVWLIVRAAWVLAILTAAVIVVAIWQLTQ